MRRLHLAWVFLAVLGVGLLLVSRSPMRAQQAGGAIPIDNDDLGGVVTGPKGPEAGVWVIAETSDLPTKFAKIVVTDDRGRYLIPDLPKANYNVWVRGYGLVDSPKTQAIAGKMLNLTAVPAPNPRAAAAVLPGRLLVLAHEGARQERVPGHGRHRKRDLAVHADAGAVDSLAQVGRLHGVPSDRHQGHARDSEGARHLRVVRRGVGSAHSVRPGGRADERGTQHVRPPARARDVRRLDRSDRRRRSAAGAAASARHRAQHRHHAVGLGRSEIVPARFGVDRSPQSAAQSVRADLRLARAELGLRAGARSGEAHRQPDSAVGARSEHAADQPEDAAPVAVLGRRSRSGRARTTCTTRCSTRRTGSG